MNGPLGITVRMIRHVTFLRDPRLDVAFVEFAIVNSKHFEDIVPLDIEDAQEGALECSCHRTRSALQATVSRSYHLAESANSFFGFS